MDLMNLLQKKQTFDQRISTVQGCRNRGSNDPSDFGRSVIPYLNQGADNDHQITTKGQAILTAILPQNKRNALRI